MEHKKVAHFMYVPFTGLGMYGGHRGSRWLRNRIKIFKQFVLPSLLNQTNKDFILWVSWRHEDRGDKIVQAFYKFLDQMTPLRVVFTYSGVCFWDDKYPEAEARERLMNAIHGSMGELLNTMGGAETILMTIQPSDDVYRLDAVEIIQKTLQKQDLQAMGFKSGYVMDYVNYRLSEWNPTTTPPFYTIKFNREQFGCHDVIQHLNHTGPYQSHEYVKDFLKMRYLDEKGFIVGTHGENISTIFNHPFAQHESLGDNIPAIVKDFGLEGVPPLKLKTSLRKRLFRKFPPNWQKKMRYLIGERGVNRIYQFMRS